MGKTDLYKACETLDHAKLRKYLNKHTSDVTQYNRSSSFSVCCYRGDLSIIQLWLEYFKDYLDESMLHNVCRTIRLTNTPVIKFLLENFSTMMDPFMSFQMVMDQREIIQLWAKHNQAFLQDPVKLLETLDLLSQDRFSRGVYEFMPFLRPHLQAVLTDLCQRNPKGDIIEQILRHYKSQVTLEVVIVALQSGCRHQNKSLVRCILEEFRLDERMIADAVMIAARSRKYLTDLEIVELLLREKCFCHFSQLGQMIDQWMQHLDRRMLSLVIERGCPYKRVNQYHYLPCLNKISKYSPNLSGLFPLEPWTDQKHQMLRFLVEHYPGEQLGWDHVNQFLKHLIENGYFKTVKHLIICYGSANLDRSLTLYALQRACRLQKLSWVDFILKNVQFDLREIAETVEIAMKSDGNIQKVVRSLVD